MAIEKILCACGVGLGSSMLVRMNVEKVLKDWNYKGIEVTHSTVSDAFPGAADLFIVGADLEQFTKNLENVILLRNLIDISELKEKMKPYFPDAE